MQRLRGKIPEVKCNRQKAVESHGTIYMQRSKIQYEPDTFRSNCEQTAHALSQQEAK